MAFRPRAKTVRNGVFCGPRPSVDHDLARDVTILVVVEVQLGDGEAVADELRAPAHRLLSALVLRKRDALAVLERARLPVDRHRDARVALRVHAEDLHDLEVRAIVAARLHAPFLQVIGDVGRCEAKPFGVHAASLQLIGRDVAEPLFQLVGRDRCHPAAANRAGRGWRGRGRGAQTQDESERKRQRAARQTGCHRKTILQQRSISQCTIRLRPEERLR